MSNDFNNINGSSGVTNQYDPNSGYCWYRLPCGICERTNQPCPKAGNHDLQITWTTATNEVTCK